jgi:lipopolysaccharide transport system ATP-binding protein
MTETIIRAEKLGKRYVLRHGGNSWRQKTFRETLTDLVSRPSRRGAAPTQAEEFWALRDVSFDIRRGEVLGIIGRNGAGKSTLLKVLSRITAPTSGRVSIKGRVASLLEVGTGFHPELSGRENIFLNGAILGMPRTEIRAKFDEIIAFAKVEKFLDTPVKRYSSGMYMRLAFAMAAHLEPEILVVDEVLAVGDAEFQKKCLGKMKAIAAGEGRTVLFVSHNMGAVEQLCTRAILLDRGQLSQDSQDVRSVVQSYLHPQGAATQRPEWTATDPQEFSSPWFAPRRLRLVDATGQTLSGALANDQEAWIEIEAEVAQIDPALSVGYVLFSPSNDLLYWSFHTDAQPHLELRLTPGRNILRTRLPEHFLNEGTYRIELLGSIHYRFWILEPGANTPTIYFEVRGGLSDSPFWNGKRPGLLAPVLPWEAAAP